jgi:hypothetical protein
MGDLSGDGLLCVLVAVVILAIIIVRGVILGRRRRAADHLSTEDKATQAYEAGRAPTDPGKWWPPGS